MSRQFTTSRASRNRRMVAMSIWLGLIVTAVVIWNRRAHLADVSGPSETVACLLAVFSAFVSLFAWMLFNPARGVSAETTTLMLAGAATLFPPCIIAFWTMPTGSPLSGWLTPGLFVLLVVVVMSPVPEEFFGVPRSRHSYIQQISLVGLGEQSVLELRPDWLQSTDLTAAVPEFDRPSLAPNSWQDPERLLPRTERQRRNESGADPKKPDPPGPESPKRKRIPRRLRKRQSPDEDSVTGAGESPSEEESGGQKQKSLPSPTTGEPGARPSMHHDLSDPFFEESSRRAEHGDPVSAEASAGRVRRDDELQVADQSRQTDFQRVTDELGGEMIEGTVTIRFDPGQKRANVHVPFSPPLSGRPVVECETVDDNSIRVKVPERRAWGLRIEGRRTDTGTCQVSEIAFSAVYMPAH